MIIVLKGADFSANKIGTVAIPRTSLDPTTDEILLQYNKSLSVDIKYAFDDMIIALKAASIWDKITNAYFPCIANSINEALYEAKGKINLASLVNAGSVETSAYLLDTYGLKTRAWVDGDGYNNTYLEYTYGIKANSCFTASLFKKEESTSMYVSAVSGAVYQDAGQKGFLLGSAAANGLAAKNIGQHLDYNVLIGNVKNPGNSEALISSTLNGGTSQNKFTYGTGYPNSDVLRDQFSIAMGSYSQWFYNTWPVAVQLFGNELTDEEVQTLNSILTTFNSVLIA